MTDSFNVQKRVASFFVSPEEQGYSKVILYAGVDEDGNAVTYEAGDDTGKALEIKNDFATPEMAANILATIRGFRYQPFNAEDAQVDPSAELGDAVTINGVYSGIYRKSLKFGRQALSSLAAPGSTEIEHAFNLESASDRSFSRFVKSTRSMITQTNQRISLSVEELREADKKLSAALVIQADQIAAKVESRKDGSWNSFGWNLTDSSWTLTSGTTTVLKADRSGIEVRGTVKADSFSTFGGEVLGSAYGTFTGETYAGNVDYGGAAGYFDGYGISSSTIGTGPLTWGVNSSLNNGDDAYDWLSGYNTRIAIIERLSVGRYLGFQGYDVGVMSIKDGNGNTKYVLGVR